VAARAPGGTFHLEVNGVDKTGPLTIPNTGSYQTWTNVTKTGVSLAAGQQVWRVVFDAAGSVMGNFNYIRVTSGSSGGGGSTPFTGTPLALPGTVEAENFDNGGEGVAFHDLTPANEGGQYRATGVDLEASVDTGGGFSVGYALPGEWLNYRVNVATAGTYNLDVRVASNGQGGTFHVEVNGVDKTGPITIPNTGGWWAWTTIRKTGVSLSAGQQTIRLVMDSIGTTGFVGNINWLRLTQP
jgi:Carbohydrate binding module (family 6)